MREENLDYLKPRHREWSLANTNTPPTVILVCGIDGCDEYVGEVKTDKADSEIAIALIYNRFGERTVPCTPLQTSDLTTQTLRLPIYADSSRTQDTPAVGVIGCFAEVI
jgi:hypothetical protein